MTYPSILFDYVVEFDANVGAHTCTWNHVFTAYFWNGIYILRRLCIKFDIHRGAQHGINVVWQMDSHVQLAWLTNSVPLQFCVDEVMWSLTYTRLARHKVQSCSSSSISSNSGRRRRSSNSGVHLVCAQPM